MNNPNLASKGVIQVLFIAAEADPFIKVGGLGDVAGSLPAALRKLDPALTGGYLVDVRLAIPFHGAINTTSREVKPLVTVSVPKPGGTVEAQVFQTEHDGLPVYLISGEPIPPEAPVYSLDTQKDGEKYAFFSLAVLQMLRALNWQPDIIHANDWHTAASVFMLDKLRRTDPFFKLMHSVITIHNLPYMGAGIASALDAFGIPPSNDQRLPEWGRHFPLLMGLSTADQIIAVSPTYAREILTPEMGLGVQDFLNSRADSVSGILNGLDQANWDPSTDPALRNNFSLKTLPKRAYNKAALQEEFDLTVDPSMPLIILISRMDQQKGVDLAINGLRQVTHLPWQAILLGSGDPNLENACRHLEADFPDRVRAAIRFDVRLSRRMYAGGDCLLMPSRYEPCGLAQMIAMRYGCLPIAHAVGGLRDTVLDVPGKPKVSTGYLFEEATAEAVAAALTRAVTDFSDKPGWIARQKFGMQQDFSWTKYAAQYAHTYLKLKEEG